MLHLWFAVEKRQLDSIAARLSVFSISQRRYLPSTWPTEQLAMIFTTFVKQPESTTFTHFFPAEDGARSPRDVVGDRQSYLELPESTARVSPARQATRPFVVRSDERGHRSRAARPPRGWRDKATGRAIVHSHQGRRWRTGYTHRCEPTETVAALSSYAHVKQWS